MVVSNFKVGNRVQISSGDHKGRVGVVTGIDGNAVAALIATVLLDPSNGDGSESILVHALFGRAAVSES